MKLPDEIRAFFRKQGKIGAAKRHAGMTPERRSEVARLAAETRWARAHAEADSKLAGKSKPNTSRKSQRTGGTT
jgi:hypothetical protein